jgi:two-component sensor histidine kinase
MLIGAASLSARPPSLFHHTGKHDESEELALAVVKSQVSHLRDLGGTRIAFDGPSLRIAPRSAQVIGIAVHELATNALKFGALSNIDGFVLGPVLS